MEKHTEKTLFDPVKVGAIECKNRIFMAPLTRQRGTKDGLLTDWVLEYYTQRAGFGLIITEASAVSRRGNTFIGALEIYEKKHMESWKKIVDSVH